MKEERATTVKADEVVVTLRGLRTRRSTKTSYARRIHESSKKIRRGNTRLAVEAERAVSLGADGELGLDSTPPRETLFPQRKTRRLRALYVYVAGELDDEKYNYVGLEGGGAGA